MKILVTGGAGFIGSAIAREAISGGLEVRIFDNFQTGFESNIPPGAEVVRGDLREADAVSRVCKGVDVIFHQAAFKSVPKSIADPVMSESSNALGTLHLLMGAQEHGVQRVIYASSSSAYGDSAEAVKHEDMPANPISPYGVSKLAGEHYCRVWSKVLGLSTICLRYFNVFGPGQHPESQYSAVFPAFISALANGEAPTIYGTGEQSRDFTFIDDVVAANMLAAKAGQDVNGSVINVCAGAPRTVNEVFRSIADALGATVEPVYAKSRTGEILHSHGDNSKALGMLGWKPQADWDESVKATVEWFVEQTEVLSRAGSKGLDKA